MATFAEQARINGMKGGRPKGSVDKRTLLRNRVEKKVQEMIVRKSAALVRAGMSVALGQQFVYRIDEEFEDDTVRTNKDGEEIVTKGKLKKRVHVLVTDPQEIESALDQMEGHGIGGDNDEYYYITTKEPDYKAIDMLMSRAYGKPKESLDLNVEHSFSLLRLAKKRDEMLDGNDVMTILDQGEMLAMPQVHIESANDTQVVVEATPTSNVIVESHE